VHHRSEWPELRTTFCSTADRPAAAFRLALSLTARGGCNHFSAAVSGNGRGFLMIRAIVTSHATRKHLQLFDTE